MNISLLTWDRSRIAPAAVERRRVASALTGLAMLAGMAIAIAPGGSHTAGAVVAAVGAVMAAVVLAPIGWATLARRPLATPAVLAIVGALVAWIVVSITQHEIWAAVYYPSQRGILYSQIMRGQIGLYNASRGSIAPTRVGRLGILPLTLTLLCSAGGLVLLADAVRGVIGVTAAPRAPWRLLTAAPTRRTVVTWSAIAGVVLVVASAFFAIDLLQPYAGRDPISQVLVLLGVAAGAALLVGSPVLVGALMRMDRDQAGRAREEERLRFAAHLHDSVLQTLALVQRQASDPAAVSRLARRQEHALRAWMAGAAELSSETLVAAIREVVAGVEDEHATTIECTALGDRTLDRGGEALAAAAREALRNAAHHGAGAPVVVFCEIGRDGAQVFIRDQGPGFALNDVPPERRGIRDAIIGRMAAAGGEATVESVPGEGTEVALRLGDRRTP
jgi:signal transduction histidine kinase